jgi:signal transduction histidine kinase
MPRIRAGEILEQMSMKYRNVLIRLLQMHPNIHGVFVTFAGVGPAIVEAIEALQLQETIQSLVFDVDEKVVKLVVNEKLRAVVGQDMYLTGYVALILAHAARHAPVMPIKQDGRWRLLALQGFLDAHPNIPPDTEHKLRQIIIELEEHAHEPAYMIDTGVEVLGKERILDVLASDYENMRESLADKIDALGKEITIRRQTEQELRRLNEELEQRVIERTTELKAVQDELLRQERLATLGKLAATISHEIRNPLATIRTSAFAITCKVRDKGLGVERTLERLERSITRCDNIIAELLDYTRMPDLKLEPVLFDPWLKQLLTELTVPDGFTLSQDLASGVEISLDPERFRRVIINLFDNACQAMLERDQSTERPSVLSIQSAVIDQQLKISIADTGPGIPPDILPHIFDPLYSTKSFGVGLGLSVVREIMKQHNGQIEISSEVGKGTQTTLWLPLLQKERDKE